MSEKRRLTDMSPALQEAVKIHYGKLGRSVPKYVHGYVEGHSEQREKISRMQKDGKLFVPIEIKVKD